jgi:hypothetical protein
VRDFVKLMLRGCLGVKGIKRWKQGNNTVNVGLAEENVVGTVDKGVLEICAMLAYYTTTIVWVTKGRMSK